MNEEIKHHAKGLASALKKAAEEFIKEKMPNDFSFEGETKLKVKKNGKTYEKKFRYSSDASFEEVKEEE